MDQSVFSQVDPCCGDTGSQNEDPCCNNELHIIEGQDELASSNWDLDLQQQAFLVAYFYGHLFDFLSKEVVPFRDYVPPNLITDIHLVDQVFLI